MARSAGVNVVFDDGGAITIVFDGLQATVGGFFTYATRLTFTGFDALNFVVGIDTSDFNSNLAISGDVGAGDHDR